MRLAKDLQCLKVESYAFAAKSIDEIGRLIGGWLGRSQDHKSAWRISSLAKTYPERPACRIIWDRERHWIDVEGTSGLAEVRQYLGRRWAGLGA